MSCPNCGFATRGRGAIPVRKPELTLDGDVVVAQSELLGTYRLYRDGDAPWLFTENETNGRRLFGLPGQAGHFKDAFHEFVVDRNSSAINPNRRGTKAAAHYQLEVPAGGRAVVRLRLSADTHVDPFADFDTPVERRRREADDFYDRLQTGLSDDQRLVQRQAFAGMIWSKQFFYYDVPRVAERRSRRSRRRRPNASDGRNRDWQHLNNADIISMPDKWEYPWYAAWDLAFHCIPLALIDPEFAKEQLVLLTREWYMHPNGQLPAYEWAFGDVNPPVHAWAAWRVFQIDRKQRGGRPGDLAFLERVFHKLMLNFTWWVNRKDAEGRNIFQGGFLGLDNIGVFDRSAPLPTGGYINQADGTSWMAMYCLNLMRIALELAQHNHVYEDIATKFFEHFLHIAEAMTNIGDDGIGLWDEEDEFFYDVLQPAGRADAAAQGALDGRADPAVRGRDARAGAAASSCRSSPRGSNGSSNYRPDLAALVSRWNEPGTGERRLLSLLRGHRMKKLLRRMLDETEFLSDYGVRALSQASRASIPTCSTWNGSAFCGRVPARRIDVAACSAATPTGAGRSGCRSTT